MAIQDILGDPIPFLESIRAELTALGVKMEELPIDHICYRVERLDRYNQLRYLLINEGKLLVESAIGGRMISTFKLNQPIRFCGHNIHLLELPEPKIGSHYQEGYEHIEMIIDVSFDQFISQYSHLEFDLSGMQKAINPDIRLALRGEKSVKFHHQSLEEVIDNEQA